MPVLVAKVCDTFYPSSPPLAKGRNPLLYKEVQGEVVVGLEPRNRIQSLIYEIKH